MEFKMTHESYNVRDLGRSMAFYQEALGLSEKRRIEKEDGSYILVFLGNDSSDFRLELTWLRDHPQPYDLGEGEIHLGFLTDDFEGALAKHRAMGCVCFENKELGVYFIEDPDGYWLEIVPTRK